MSDINGGAGYPNANGVGGVNVQEPLWADRITSAVDSQLTAKGWQKVASGGDAAVSAVGATHNQQTINTFYDGMGGFGGGWGLLPLKASLLLSRQTAMA